MIPISERIKNVAPSQTTQAAELGRQLKAEGKPVISLTVGEPDFHTPDYITKAAVEGLVKHVGNHYPPIPGYPELRKAIADLHNRQDGTKFGLENVYVGAGGKTVLYIIFQVILNPGDEVLIPSPYWVSYTEQVKLAEGVPVIVEGSFEQDYKVTVADLEASKTDKTIALVLNSPSNPTGAIYSREELEAIGQWAVKNKVVIIADEMYYRLVYNGAEAVSVGQLSDEILAQSIIVNGFSKGYAMTGWRLGYAIADEATTKAISKMGSQLTGPATGIAQEAGIAALEQEAGQVQEMVDIFEDRLNKAYDLLIQVPGFKLPAKPEGAFYLFPDVTEAAKMTGHDSVDDFVISLINEKYVVTVTGSAFGNPDCLRLSYSVSEEDFAEAIKRMTDYINENKK